MNKLKSWAAFGVLSVVVFWSNYGVSLRHFCTDPIDLARNTKKRTNFHANGTVVPLASSSESVCEKRTNQNDIFDYQWNGDEQVLRKALASAETKFSGGVVLNIPCGEGHICMGSDRMSGKYHDYSKCYAAWLNKWRQRVEQSPQDFNPLLVAEVGILKGSGLAIWSDLFGCDAQIHGFDRYLQNTLDNMDFMKSRGAFAKDNLQLHTMEQTKNNSALIQEIAKGQKFAFVIDDGYHRSKSMQLTFDSFKSSLHQNFLYIIEDFRTGDMEEVKRHFEKDGIYDIHTCGGLPILAITPTLHPSKE